MRAAHIMVCGDAGTGKVKRVRRLAEESLAAGRRIIYFSNNKRAFGLSSMFDVARFGVDTHNIEMTHQDGAHFARATLDLRQSIVFDFRGMRPENVSTFLTGFIDVLNTTETVDFDVFFECLDDLIGRKRHRDRNTANTFRSLLLRGPAENGGNGVRVTVGATSPDEVPIETSRHSLTIIGTRTGANENVKALSACVGGHPTLYQCTVNIASSIRAVQDEQQWLWPMSEGSAAPHMPYYCPLTPLQSDAGGGDLLVVETNDAERAVIEQVVQLRAAESAIAEDQTPNARKTATSSDPKRKGIRSKRGGMTDHHKQINASGVKNACKRAEIARMEIKMRVGGSLDTLVRRPVAETIAEIAKERYAVPATWAMHLYRSGKRPFSAGIGLMGYAYTVARDEDAARADAFFRDLAASGPLSQTLREQLAICDAASVSQKRFDTTMNAWKAFRNRKPTAANDDNAVAQAV